MDKISVISGLALFATILLFMAASVSTFLRNSDRPDRIVRAQLLVPYRPQRLR